MLLEGVISCAGLLSSENLKDGGISVRAYPEESGAGDFTRKNNGILLVAEANIVGHDRKSMRQRRRRFQAEQAGVVNPGQRDVGRREIDVQARLRGFGAFRENCKSMRLVRGIGEQKTC